jgi:hypothetical protein
MVESLSYGLQWLVRDQEAVGLRHCGAAGELVLFSRL